MTPRELARAWRTDATVLRKHGAEVLAGSLEQCADELEHVLAAGGDDVLTLAEASVASGYSVAHLRRLIASGVLRNVSKAGRPRLRRADLPRKPGSPGAAMRIA